MDSPRCSSPPETSFAKGTSERARYTTTFLWIFAGFTILVPWIGLLATYAAHTIYYEYLYPLVERLERTAHHPTVSQTDSTYYDRRCSSYDLTATEPSQIVLHPGLSQEEYVDRMMRHGVGVLPHLLRPDTADELREYLLARNENLAPGEEIGIIPNFERVAFAVDPAEHPVVVKALLELASHAGLKATVAGVLGDDDPAISEMASLTSFPGARHQQWHHDVFPDRGSAVQFARTFGHSYSLFIALQDTTSGLGATKVCPGTHQCGTAQIRMCDQNGFQPLFYRDDGDDDREAMWYAGDGVLFNQQLCHRGEEHNDEGERVMFVVSFTSRPTFPVDSRVLSHGLFCFTLWNTWGLTWQDLLVGASNNPTVRALRSLGLWKPANRNFGLDFVTKSILEWNVGENGMEPTEISSYARAIHRTLGIPVFLQGHVIEIDEEDVEMGNIEGDVYHIYLASTLQKLLVFFVEVNLALAAVYMLVYFVSLITSSSFTLKRTRRRLLLTVFSLYLLPSTLLFLHMWRMKESDWGRGIKSGLIFREPFPRIRQLTMLRNGLDSSVGPTTVPERTDMLIGTRLESPYLGSVARSIDYHPGNVVYRSAVAKASSHFLAYRGLPATFQLSLLNQVLESMRGRILQQDWQHGDWHVVVGKEARHRHVLSDILIHTSALTSALEATIKRLLAYLRFDATCRETSLSLEAQAYLLQLRNKLVSLLRNDACSQESKSGTTLCLSPSTAPSPPSEVPAFRPISAAIAPRREFSRAIRPVSWTSLPDDNAFRVGDTVIALEQSSEIGEFRSRATITGVRGMGDERIFDLAYERGYDELDAPLNEILPLVPLQSDTIVDCNRGPERESATVGRIRPNGRMDIEFEADGRWWFDVGRELCHWDSFEDYIEDDPDDDSEDDSESDNDESDSEEDGSEGGDDLFA